MMTSKRFALTMSDGAVRHGWIVAIIIVLSAFSPSAHASTLIITSGTFSLSPLGESWSFAGNGFSTSSSDDSFTGDCGACFAPFQLVNPLPFPIFPQGGNFTVGAKSYALPGAGFFGGSPFAVGSVFLSPQGTLPTVSAGGTYDVPFNVGGSFCVTDDPKVAPPPFDINNPACFSLLGAAIAHYTVSEPNPTNGLFFQPLPTIEITSTPEPSTLGAGVLGILFMFAVGCCRMVSRTRIVNSHQSST